MKKLLSILSLFILLLTSCVQEIHTKTIHFKFNTNAFKNVNTVSVKGDFSKNKWNEPVFLKDKDKDGIYEAVIIFETAKNTMNFKFLVNEDFELKDKDNRTIRLDYKPEIVFYSAIFNDAEKVKIEKQ